MSDNGVGTHPYRGEDLSRQWVDRDGHLVAVFTVPGNALQIICFTCGMVGPAYSGASQRFMVRTRDMHADTEWQWEPWEDCVRGCDELHGLPADITEDMLDAWEDGAA